MKVLVACEYSGAVRDAFIALGHDAMSCDLLPTDAPGPHYQGDVFDIINGTPAGTYKGVEFCDLSSFEKEQVNFGIIEEDLAPWDLMIAHPPCTHLSVSGARHFEEKRADGRQQAAIDFFMRLAEADISRIAIENPICIMSSVWRKPDQVIQPWQFGHGETKATALWLKCLPLLQPTNIVSGREARINRMPPSADRWKLRSATYAGIAKAMAEQWAEPAQMEMAA